MASPPPIDHVASHPSVMTHAQLLRNSPIAGDPRFQAAEAGGRDFAKFVHTRTAESSRLYKSSIASLQGAVREAKAGKSGISRAQIDQGLADLNARHEAFINNVNIEIHRSIPTDGLSALEKFHALHNAHQGELKALADDARFFSDGAKDNSAGTATGVAVKDSGAAIHPELEKLATGLTHAKAKHENEFQAAMVYGKDFSKALGDATKNQKPTWKQWAREAANPIHIGLVLFSGVQALSLIVMAYTQRQVAKQGAQHPTRKPEDSGLAVESEGVSRKMLQSQPSLNGVGAGGQMQPPAAFVNATQASPSSLSAVA